MALTDAEIEAIDWIPARWDKHEFARYMERSDPIGRWWVDHDTWRRSERSNSIDRFLENRRIAAVLSGQVIVQHFDCGWQLWFNLPGAHENPAIVSLHPFAVPEEPPSLESGVYQWV